MISLLDVNVLIALVDPAHPHHAAATAAFSRLGRDGWATCPLTENGFIRILGLPKDKGGLGSTELARDLLGAYCASPGHQFWPDDVRLLDRALIPQLPASRDLTDVYLLALAVRRQGVLLTFDAGIDAGWIPGGVRALRVLAG